MTTRQRHAPLLSAWFAFAFGREGQSIVASEGLAPLTPAQVHKQLQRLDLVHE